MHYDRAANKTISYHKYGTKNVTYKISVVTPLKISRERGAALSPCDVGRMLEALSVLLKETGAKPSGTFSCWRFVRAN